MVKKEFKLECECGDQEFYVTRDIEGDAIEIRCTNCGKCVARVNRYAIDWVMEDADADSAD